jgi:hypothetical protein
MQRMISATLTAVGMEKQQLKGPSSRALEIEHFIPLHKQHLLVYKHVWELSGKWGVSLLLSH